MCCKQSPVETALHDQTQLLPKKKLYTVLIAVSLCQLVSFFDQSCIGVLQPTIARDLHAGSTIAWASTTALIGSCAFTPLWGRLSDLFGRKNVLIAAMLALCVSDVACALVSNAPGLSVCRGFAGLAGGGINSLVNMVVSDVVSLKERGMYQGIVGLQVGLGSAFGPLVASALTDTFDGNWHGIFYFLAPTAFIVAGIVWLLVPSSMPRVNLKETIANVDFAGLITIVAAVTLFLIAIAGGGHPGSAWTSPKIITMLAVAGTLFVAFLLIEWKWAMLPMMPMSMFCNASIAVMMAQSCLLGMTYYSFNTCANIYLQNALGQKATTSAAIMILPALLQSAVSAGAGYYQSRVNRYKEIFCFGFSVWALGCALVLFCRATSSLWLFGTFSALMGMGMGCSFQPMLAALQAHAPKSQRAVITSFRNFLRSAGGSSGLAISSVILGRSFRDSLPGYLSSVASSTFARPDLSGFTSIEKAAIAAAYADASGRVFMLSAPLLLICLLLCIFIKDNGLDREEDGTEKRQPSEDGAIEISEAERGIETQGSGTLSAAESRDSQCTIDIGCESEDSSLGRLLSSARAARRHQHCED